MLERGRVVRTAGERERESEQAERQALAAHAETAASRRDAYAPLRYRDFRLLLAARFLGGFGEQMLGVAIGWELYARTHSALALGFVGLAQILPVIALALPAGQAADRYDRRGIAIVTEGLLAACALGLALLSVERGALPLVYLCLFCIGVGRAFNDPASSTLLPQIVPTEHFAVAAAWSSSSGQLAAVLGPALGGVLIALTGSAAPVYLLILAGGVTVIVLLVCIRSRQPARATEATSLGSLVAGLHFLGRTPVLLAAITLDLFAVLLGGAVTLLPIFASDILHVGATGLGLMRAAPSAGALLMAVAVAHLPPFKRAGRTLLAAVAGFGLATIVFGMSRSFPLTLLMLALLGALDNVSVVIRSTLLLTRAPDAVRGRISAVNSVFVGASNELGGFESGLAAALFGPVIAVAAGGVGTLVVVAAVALIWPQMRTLGRLDEG
jgi:MFS family permease